MSFDPNAPKQPVVVDGSPLADTPSGEPPFSDVHTFDQDVPHTTGSATTTVVGEGEPVVVGSPLGSDGNPLVPGTPDEQIVADRVDGSPEPNKAYFDHVDATIKSLDALIDLVGQDLSEAVLSEFKHRRVAGVGLKVVLATLESARAVVAGLDLVNPSVVRVSEGVVNG